MCLEIGMSCPAVDGSAAAGSACPALCIREETPADAPGVRAVLESAFPTHAEADLVDALRNVGGTRILVAALTADPAGVVAAIVFSPVTIESGRAGASAARPWNELSFGTVSLSRCCASVSRRVQFQCCCGTALCAEPLCLCNVPCPAA